MSFYTRAFRRQGSGLGIFLLRVLRVRVPPVLDEKGRNESFRPLFVSRCPDPWSERSTLSLTSALPCRVRLLNGLFVVPVVAARRFVHPRPIQVDRGFRLPVATIVESRSTAPRRRKVAGTRGQACRILLATAAVLIGRRYRSGRLPWNQAQI